MWNFCSHDSTNQLWNVQIWSDIKTIHLIIIMIITFHILTWPTIMCRTNTCNTLAVTISSLNCVLVYCWTRRSFTIWTLDSSSMWNLTINASACHATWVAFVTHGHTPAPYMPWHNFPGHVTITCTRKAISCTWMQKETNPWTTSTYDKVVKSIQET